MIKLHHSLMAATLAAGALFAGSAQASHVNWSVSIAAPVVSTVVSNGRYYGPPPAQVYYSPAPVYYPPAPVYSEPQPVVYYPQAPVYVQAPEWRPPHGRHYAGPRPWGGWHGPHGGGHRDGHQGYGR